jgi:predicted permease
MGMIGTIWRRLRYMVTLRSAIDDDLEQEIRLHIETRADELEREGVPAGQALAMARREFGPALRIREDARAEWQFSWFEHLASDVRYSLRALSRNPGFAAAAIGCLGLGIGANTVVYSLTIDALFSPPSCKDPGSIRYTRIGGNSHSPVQAWRFLHDAHVFPEIAGAQEMAEANLRAGSDTARLWEVRVTPNFFEAMGVPVAKGRGITGYDHRTAVISYRFWQRWLGGSPDAIGRSIILDGKVHTVIGILPDNHRTFMGLGLTPDVYVPVEAEDETVAFLVRVPPGVSNSAVAERLKPVLRELDKVMPNHGANDVWETQIHVSGVTGIERMESLGFLPVAGFFGALTVVVALVLLIACTNVASLLLARASARGHELAVRAALGASRGRIVRQLLSESSVLAAGGCSCGLVMNLWLTSMLNRIDLPLPVPLRLHIAPDWRLLCYLIILAAASAILAGLVPALRATRANVQVALKQGERQVGRSKWNLRSGLVATQVALSTVLLVSGALFLHNLLRANKADFGIDTKHTVWAYMRLAPDKYPTAETERLLIQRCLEQLRALAGVESASIARIIPLNDSITNGTTLRPDSGPPVGITFQFNAVAPDYFRTMGIPIVAGREFTQSERPGAPKAVVLNQTMARRLFGNANPVGHTITWGEPHRVVGVAKDSKYFVLSENHEPAMYGAYLQQRDYAVNLHFVVRVNGDPWSIVKTITGALSQLDPTAAVDTKPMSQAMALALLPSQAGAAIIGSTGVLGLVLAAIGLAGLLLYTVARRTREIGLRVALGATPGDLATMVLRQSMAPVLSGVAVGLMLAWFASRPLGMFLLPEIASGDSGSFLAVAAVFLIVAGASTVPPLLRAIHIDPGIALRYE